ncbi:MAG: helix-turn-helix domain-containing protein [Kurthia sp.]|nr:helix-turn-helix domain-containing protein [Candidatus Kurthia equi]
MEIMMKDITMYFASASVSLTNVFQDKVAAVNTYTHIHTQSSALIFPISGSSWVHSGKGKFFVTPGKVLHVNAHNSLHIENCGDQDFQFIVTQYQIAERFAEDLYDDAFLLRLAGAEVYESTVIELLKMQASPGAMVELNRRALFFKLIQKCVEGARDQQLQSTIKIMDQVVEYIEQNYQNKINVTKIAELFKLERRRLAYLFERHTGLAPNTYITEYRISKAKELLERADLSIAEVAERVGYEDCFYFSRVFKKITGLAPSTYRRKKMTGANV